jgi:hypothetical protein
MTTLLDIYSTLFATQKYSLQELANTTALRDQEISTDETYDILAAVRSSNDSSEQNSSHC